MTFTLKAAIGHLDPGIDVRDHMAFQENLRNLVTMMELDDGSDVINVDERLIAALRKRSNEIAAEVKKGGFAKWHEEHKGAVMAIGDLMMDLGYLSILYASYVSYISSGRAGGPSKSNQNKRDAEIAQGNQDWEQGRIGEELKRTSEINNKGPYSHLIDPPNVGPGKKFTQAQKELIIKENMKRNNGVVKSDLSGEVLVKPEKSIKGVTPPQNEWQIDHIVSMDKGGTNSYSNAQVLSRQENRAKWN